jgi:hypothetical protein
MRGVLSCAKDTKEGMGKDITLDAEFSKILSL